MNKIDFENRLLQEGLMTIYDDGISKDYIDGELLIKNGIRQNALNVFGFYKGKSSYVIFITDHERGLPYYIDRFSTENEACNALYDYITLLKCIHEKNCNC